MFERGDPLHDTNDDSGEFHFQVEVRRGMVTTTPLRRRVAQKAYIGRGLN